MNKYNPNIHHRRSIRLKGYDYSQAGAYFITICCEDRICRFGEIENGEMKLNEMGLIAFNEWLKTSEIRQNVELDVFVVMPNHIHGIIILNDMGRGELHSPNNNEIENSPNNSDNSPNNSDNLQNNSDNNLKGECDSPLRSPSNNIGAIVRGYKSSVTKQIRLINDNIVVWQRNYHEHIIRNEQSYQTILNYIVNNPAKWNNDKFYKQ
jgi:putative transposase